MEIRDLPEEENPQANDFLILQSARNFATKKVQMQNLISQEKSTNFLESCQSWEWSLLSGQPKTILPFNNARKYLILINNSENPIFLNLGAIAVSNKGILLLTKGSSFEMTNENLFLGIISAISIAESNLIGIECF